MLTHLAIDWGTKRIGIATGSLVFELALPYQGIVATTDVFDHIDHIISSNPIETIVIGLPTNVTGEPTSITFLIQDFIVTLHSKYPKLNIVSWDERFSTKDIKNLNVLGDRQVSIDKHTINHLAAMNILRSYFSSINK